MVPNAAHDPTGEYVLLVDDRPHLPPEAQAQRLVDAAHTCTQLTTTQGDARAEVAEVPRSAPEPLRHERGWGGSPACLPARRCAYMRYTFSQHTQFHHT
jgi:hypothetical protein